MSTIEAYAAPPGEISAAESLAEELESLTPEERIERTVARFAGNVVVATSFGPNAPVLLDKVIGAEPDLPIVHVRTHHETLETANIVTWFDRHSDLDVRIFDAPPVPLPRVDSPGVLAEFQRRVKVEPFEEMLDELQPAAYISGAMRWQAGRADLPLVVDQGSVLAIRPLADVSEEEAKELLEASQLPYPANYLDPTKGPDQKSECGLNTTIYPTRED